MSELTILFPEAEVVMLGRRRVEIRPVQLRHFEQFGRAAGGVFELLQAASVQQVTAYAKQHSRELGRVLVATTSLSRWRVWRLPAVVQVQLLAHVLRVNAAFFVEAQVAMAKGLDGLL